MYSKNTPMFVLIVLKIFRIIQNLIAIQYILVIICSWVGMSNEILLHDN